ncbi:hypothetical protein ES706_03102 [subsurface metagenome]
MQKDRFKFRCIYCANCCSDKKTIVNATYLDILRITKGLNLTFNEILEILGFYIYEKNFSNDFIKKMVIPPIITEKGNTFVGLLKKSTGACIFLNEKKKCKIYNLRPMFCRTFPFTFKVLNLRRSNLKINVQMFYTIKAKEYCKGISDNAPYISNKKWVKIGKKVIVELKENNKFIEIWNMNVKKGRIKPTAQNFIKTILKFENKMKKLTIEH